MKMYIFQTLNTPADRDIAELRRRLSEVRIDAQLIDADSRDGSALAELYDVMQRPSVVVADDNGSLLEKWEGRLPTLNEVMLYNLNR